MDRKTEFRMMRYLPFFEKASQKWNIPLDFLLSVGYIESRFRGEATSPKGAQGIMQVMPFNLKAMGIDPKKWNDPETNIDAGARYIANDVMRHGWDLSTEEGRILALRAYNAGYGSVKKGYIPAETRGYIAAYQTVNPKIRKLISGRSFDPIQAPTSRLPAIELYKETHKEGTGMDSLEFVSGNLKRFHGVEKDFLEIPRDIENQRVKEGTAFLVPSADGKEWIHSGYVFRGDDHNVYVADSTKKDGVKIWTPGEWLNRYPLARSWNPESPPTKEESLQVPTAQVSSAPANPSIEERVLRFPPDAGELPFWSSFFEGLSRTPFFTGGVAKVKALAAERILNLAPILGASALTESFWIERGLQPEFWELYPHIAKMATKEEGNEQKERSAYAEFLRALYTGSVSKDDLGRFGLSPQEVMRGLLTVAEDQKNPHLLSEEMLQDPFLRDEVVIQKGKIETTRRNIFSESGGDEFVMARLSERIGKGRKENIVSDLLNIVSVPLIPLSERKDFLSRALISSIEHSDSISQVDDLISEEIWKALGLQDRYPLYAPELKERRERLKVELEKKEKERQYLENYVNAQKAVVMGDVGSLSALRKSLREEDIEKLGNTVLDSLNIGIQEMKNPEIFRQVIEKLVTFDLTSSYVRDMFLSVSFANIDEIDQATILFRMIPESARKRLVPSHVREYLAVNADLLQSVPKSERMKVLQNLSRLSENAEVFRTIQNEPFSKKTLRLFRDGVTEFFGQGSLFLSPYDSRTRRRFLDPDSPFVAPMREVWKDAYGVALFLGMSPETAEKRANAALRENFAVYFNDRRTDSGMWGILDEPSIIPAQYSGASYISAIDKKVLDLLRVATDEIVRTEVVWQYIDGEPTKNFYVLGEREDGVEIIMKDYAGNSLFSIEKK